MDASTPSRRSLSIPNHRVDGVSYCINPNCRQTQDLVDGETCQHCGTPLWVDGRYRLVRSLRAMNPLAATDVFEVESRRPDRTRKVMKVLKDTDPQAIDHFEREALALQWLDHPGIPKVDLSDYFTVEIPGPDTVQMLHCLVMEKIEGENLEEWIRKRSRIDQKTAIAWLKQLLDILTAIHDHQFFHRDIKPSNIMRRSQGQLVLIDFGSVRNLSNTYVAAVHAREVTASLSIGYTPQEQIDGQAVPQSDLFALGRTFVYLLTGMHPADLSYYPGSHRLNWHQEAPQISKAFKNLIDELMAPEPGQRPLSAASVYRNLSEHQIFLTDLRLTFTSRQFKRRLAVLLILGVTTVSLYYLSFPLLNSYYYKRGVKALESNKFEQALEYYEKALSYDKNDAKSYNDKGIIYQIQGDLNNAEEMFEKAVVLAPDNWIAAYNLGGIYDETGDLENAKAYYRKVISSTTHPVADKALSSLARLNILDDQLEKAIALTSYGIQNDPGNEIKAALYKNRGWAYFLMNNHVQASTDLRMAIALDQERTDAHCLLAQVLEAQGKEADALKFWRQCRDGDSLRNLEVRVWQTMARQRLMNQEK